jgi:uncharacterized DUF497 family protein
VSLAKHGVAFDDTARVLADPGCDAYHLHAFDEACRGDADRYRTTASHPADRLIVLRITRTERRDHRGARTTRILGVRPATRQERTAYAQAIADRRRERRYRP